MSDIESLKYYVATQHNLLKRNTVIKRENPQVKGSVARINRPADLKDGEIL